MKKLSTQLVVLLTGAIMTCQSFAGTPPRFYLKSLAGGNAIPVISSSMSGNINPLHTNQVIDGSTFDAEVTMAGYAKSFVLFDKSALLAVLVPMGRVSGEGNLLGHEFRSSANGFGDPTIELDLNLIGPDPIRNIPDLIRYEPGFSLDVLVDVVLPVGEYDNKEVVNLGQNRWFGRVAFPITWQIGQWIPGQRTTLELLPSLWVYGDNDDFLDNSLSTDPKFELEAHLTRDFTKDVWASFDTVYMNGGESTIQGMKGEKIDSLTIGFTVGYQINDNLALTMGYSSSINDDDPMDVDMDAFTISIVFGWHNLIEGMNRLQSD
jgi:hypothetical protein